MSASLRTKDGSFSAVGAAISHEVSRSPETPLEMSEIVQWAKENGIKRLSPPDQVLKAANAKRVASKLPKFSLKVGNQTRAKNAGSPPTRAKPAPLQPIVKTEDELLELVASHTGTKTGLLTPQVANWLLDLNTGNRSVMPSNVDRFRRMLREGHWQNTGEPIIVSREGILNDGQHRLIAIKDTDITAEADIRFGVPRIAFQSTGTGKRRTAAQVLSIEGYSDSNCQASIARLVLAYDTNQMGNFRQRIAESSQILKVVDSEDSIPQVTAKIRRLKFKPVRAGGFGFVLVIAARHVGIEKAFEFADLVASGLAQNEGDPSRVLHVRLRDVAMRRERSDQVDLAAMTAKAWNAWIRGETMQAIRLSGADRTSEGFPKLGGADPVSVAA